MLNTGPERLAMRNVPQAGSIHVAAAVIRNPNGAVLVAQRPEDAHQGGLWEFPGGKVESGEDVATALDRELNEELGIEVSRARPLICVHHDYGDRRVLLDVWSVDVWHGRPRGREGQPLQWVMPEALSGIAMPAADLPIVNAVRLPTLYLVTPEPDDPHVFLARLGELLSDGVSLVQFRAKSLGDADFAALAGKVIGIAHERGGRVLLNATPELAMRLNADGVHLTSERLRNCSRRPLPLSRWVAASCHNAEDLNRAREIGVDFVVLGPVQPTASHASDTIMGWERFTNLARCASIPVYAIGGMGRADLSIAWWAGGQGVAAIAGLWN